MEIRSEKNCFIITPLCSKLESRFGQRFLKEISDKDKEIALDLNYVSDCTIEVIEAIKEVSKTHKLGVFNINSDIFALFNFMQVDKFVNIFVSELDFKENSRQLINRKFTLV